jgi:Uma2 family endonuclease
MGTPLEHRPLSEEAYLSAEDSAVTKSEYLAGEVFAMAGGSERHNRIAGNIFFHLRAATRGHPCRALMADMKLRIAGDELVVLACTHGRRNPKRWQGRR